MTRVLPNSGIQLGVSTLRQQAELFGINAQPPIDLPSNSEQPVGGTIVSTLQHLSDTAQAYQGYSAIGQDYRSGHRVCRTRWWLRASPTMAL